MVLSITHSHKIVNIYKKQTIHNHRQKIESWHFSDKIHFHFSTQILNEFDNSILVTVVITRLDLSIPHPAQFGCKPRQSRNLPEGRWVQSMHNQPQLDSREEGMRERELWGKVKRSTKIRNHLIGIILQKDILLTLRSPRWIGLTTKKQTCSCFQQ